MNVPESNEARAQAGFTLIEALIAILILSFGLMAIANLFVVASTTNAVADSGTSSAAVASQVMERLKAMPFGSLVVGGDANANNGPLVDCLTGNLAVTWNCDAAAPLTLAGGGVDGYTIHVQWEIAAAGGVGAPASTVFIRVGAQPRTGILSQRARAEFTTWRTLTP